MMNVSILTTDTLNWITVTDRPFAEEVVYTRFLSCVTQCIHTLTHRFSVGEELLFFCKGSVLEGGPGGDQPYECRDATAVQLFCLEWQ